ncbi:MAG: hypothetical protein ACPGQL_03245 [Thermoplasmatota archaeon]
MEWLLWHQPGLYGSLEPTQRDDWQNFTADGRDAVTLDTQYRITDHAVFFSQSVDRDESWPFWVQHPTLAAFGTLWYEDLRWNPVDDVELRFNLDAPAYRQEPVGDDDFTLSLDAVVHRSGLDEVAYGDLRSMFLDQMLEHDAPRPPMPERHWSFLQFQAQREPPLEGPFRVQAIVDDVEGHLAKARLEPSIHPFSPDWLDGIGQVGFAVEGWLDEPGSAWFQLGHAFRGAAALGEGPVLMLQVLPGDVALLMHRLARESWSGPQSHDPPVEGPIPKPSSVGNEPCLLGPRALQKVALARFGQAGLDLAPTDVHGGRGSEVKVDDVLKVL